jgi:lipopolysaccharide/colanic/teichoic acid biosynthesis glycosyltransferase
MSALLRLADGGAKQVLDRLVALVLLLILMPLIAAVVVAIRVESPGPGFFRCRRVGHRGREFGMLKFRKMHEGAQGPKLTAPDDDRFTRFGRWLASSKLDEVPQLWNVLRGQMTLVGPRPEDPRFVEIAADAYAEILSVKPGITGFSQLAFARESDILDPDDRFGCYVGRLLPEKTRLDRLYVSRRSLALDLRILVWTAAVVFGREVAVHRGTGRLNLRRRPSAAPETSAAEELGAA